MRIITISREFGSGGRELGKRLSDILGIDYYDREIIAAIAEKHGMDIKRLENHGWRTVPLTYRHSFGGSVMMQASQTKSLLEQKKFIDSIADFGKDFVIVGRNADVILEKYEPLKIFVCADMESKIQRCIERADDGENLSKKEIIQNIRRIDKNRSHTREIVSGTTWGDRANYHLVLNTSDWQIKELATAVADFAEHWFGRSR